MLRFRAQEADPQTRMQIRPTIARERELAREEPNAANSVRFAEWNTDETPEYLITPPTLPKWAIGVGLVLGCLSIAAALQQAPWFIAPAPHFLVDAPVMIFNLILLLAPYIAFLQALNARWRKDRRRLSDDLQAEAFREERLRGISLPRKGPIHGELTAEMTLWQEGVCYGEDFGYLRFEGSALSFEGLRTDFSISRSRLHRIPAKPDMRHDFVDRFGLARSAVFAFREGGADYVVQFQRLGLEGEHIASREFWKLGEWMREAVVGSQVEILPPQTAAPGMSRRVRRHLTTAFVSAPLAMALTINFIALTSFLLFVAGTAEHENEMGLVGWILAAVYGCGAIALWVVSARSFSTGLRTTRVLKRMQRSNA